MNELLLSEIKSDKKELLQVLRIIEAVIFGPDDQGYDNIKAIIEDCQQSISDIDEPLEQAERLINHLYVDHLFIDTAAANLPIGAYQLHSGLAQSELAPTLKLIVIAHIMSACGFEVDAVFVPKNNMIRLICNDIYAIVFDPMTGAALNWHELDDRMDELDGDPSQLDLPPIERNSLIAQHLTALKNILIREQEFDKALKCVDILLALCPDDPFERRDRGFLLHQLDCFKVAYDDYRFFVEQCPQDPAAQLLKMQLEQITIKDTVLH